MFSVAASNMRLYYYDQEMSKVTGPEEMKWGSKVIIYKSYFDGRTIS